MNKRISSAIRLAISASLLYIAFQWADWDQIRLSLNYADWRFLVFALAIMTLNRMLMAYKWTLLLKARGTAIPVFTATRIYYTSHFLGLLLPATIGGDAIRVFLVKRLGVSIPKTLSSILVERIVGFITLVFLVILACGLLISYQNKLDFNPSQILVGAVIVGIILILCFLLPFHPLATKLLAAIPSAITERAMQLPKFGKIIETWNGYSGYGNHKGILALFAFLTLVENLMMPVWVYYVGLGLNTQIPILYLFMFIPLITFLEAPYRSTALVFKKADTYISYRLSATMLRSLSTLDS